MAKKTANPADAHRKAQRAKELKKNKENRKKVREVVTLKKDTGGYEAEIRRLSDGERRGTLTAAEKEKLTSLRAEVERIKKTKDDYLEKHPEHRKFVYPNEEARLKAEKEKAEGKEANEGSSGGRGGPLYGKDGRLRHPERSIYYDPVLNPYGAPPPGMPYVERPRTPEPYPAELQGGEGDDDLSEEDDSESGSDDDIILPEGPPPGEASSSDDDDDEDSDDEIVMPSGPPPPKPIVQPPLPPGPPPPPGGFPPYPPPGFNPSMPPPPMGYPPGPAGFSTGGFRPPHGGFNSNFRPPHAGFNGAAPPFRPPQPFNSHQRPPPNFFPNQPHPNQANPNVRPPGSFGRPPRGFRPPPSLQHDPLSDVPHQTYQGHQIARRPPPASAGLPANPNLTPLASSSGSLTTTTSSSSSSTTTATPSAPPTTISAAPVLRDFRKESAAFVPTAVKRKAALAASRPKPITSAPAEPEPPREAGDIVPIKRARTLADPTRTDGGGFGGSGGMNEPSELMKSLGGVLGKFGGGGVSGAGLVGSTKKQDKDGYDSFLKGLDGLQ